MPQRPARLPGVCHRAGVNASALGRVYRGPELLLQALLGLIVNAERAISEHETFAEIPTYCASFLSDLHSALKVSPAEVSDKITALQY